MQHRSPNPLVRYAALADPGRTPLFYVVDWLPPDFGAVGQYALLSARHIAATGREVFLIGLTSDPRPDLAFACEPNLNILKLKAKPYEKKSFLRRLLWSLATNLQLIRAVWRHPRSRAADVQFTGAPPFLLYFAIPLKFLRKVRLIYRITDFYPEAIIAHLGRRPFLLGLLERITWSLRRRVDQFEVLGEDQRALLLRGGIPAERIVIQRDSAPASMTGQEPPAPTPPGLAGRKILLYSGNYGVAHEVETVIQGLALHHQRGSGRFGLWLNATGSSADIVEHRLRELNIPLARTPPVPLEDLPGLLAAADAHLIALRPAFAGIVLPSKVYGCIASGRPILYAGPQSSDVHLLCSAIEQRYIQITPGDAAGFAAALDELGLESV